MIPSFRYDIGTTILKKKSKPTPTQLNLRGDSYSNYKMHRSRGAQACRSIISTSVKSSHGDDHCKRSKFAK